MFLLSSCDSQYIISNNLSLKLPFLSQNDIYLSYECLNKNEFIFSLPLKFNEKFKDTDIDKIELFDKNKLINYQTLKVENISNNNFILKIKVLGNTDHIDHAKVYLKNNKAYMLPLDISWIKEDSENRNYTFELSSYVQSEVPENTSMISYTLTLNDESKIYFASNNYNSNPIYNSDLTITPIDSSYKYKDNQDSIIFSKGSFLISFSFYESISTYYFNENISFSAEINNKNMNIYSTSDNSEICLKKQIDYYNY